MNTLIGNVKRRYKGQPKRIKKLNLSETELIHSIEIFVESGDLVAMRFLENYYLTTQYNHFDIGRVRNVYINFINAGYYAYAVKLGKAYMKGKGVIKSTSEAFRYFQMAVDNNIDEGYYYLGILYLEQKNDVDKAIELLEHSKSMNPKAASVLGNIYFESKYDHINFEKAYEYYKYAADNKLKNGYLGVRLCFLLGRGVEKNYLNAYTLLSTAYRMQSSMAGYWIGYCFEHGYGITKDLNNAITYYNEAYQNGISKGLEKAKKLTEKIAKQKQLAEQDHNIGKVGNNNINKTDEIALCMNEYKKALTESNKGQAIAMLGRAKNLGSGEAAYLLAESYEFAKLTPFSPEKVRKLYKKAVELGYKNTYEELSKVKKKNTLKSSNEEILK